MASSPPLTLDVSSLGPSPINAALRFAAGFYHDVQACQGAHELAALHRRYRDQILAVDSLAANIAAVFRPLLQVDEPTALRTAGEARRWAELDELAQRALERRDRASQKLRHQSAIVAVWGPDVFNHYGWHRLPVELVRRLHDLAVLMPQWDEVVQVLNARMLARHESRVLRGRNHDHRIGEHSTSSSVQDPRSPVERKDILAALEWARDKAQSHEARQQLRTATLSINGTPIRNFGLQHDAYGMVVPGPATSPGPPRPRPMFPGLIGRPAATTPAADDRDPADHDRGRDRSQGGVEEQSVHGESELGEADPGGELALARWRASSSADADLPAHPSPSARKGPTPQQPQHHDDASERERPSHRKRPRLSTVGAEIDSQENEPGHDVPSASKRPRTTTAETLPDQSGLLPRRTRRPSTPSDYTPRVPAPRHNATDETAAVSHPATDDGSTNSSSDAEGEDAEVSEGDQTPTATTAGARRRLRRGRAADNGQRQLAVENDDDDEDTREEAKEEGGGEEEEEEEEEEEDLEQDEDTVRGRVLSHGETEEESQDEQEDQEDAAIEGEEGPRERLRRREQTESLPLQSHESDEDDDNDTDTDNHGGEGGGDSNDNTATDDQGIEGGVKDFQRQPTETPSGAYAEPGQADVDSGDEPVTHETVRAANVQESSRARQLSRVTVAVTPSSPSTTRVTPIPMRNYNDPGGTPGSLPDNPALHQTTAAATPAADETPGDLSSEDSLLHTIQTRHSHIIKRLIHEASQADSDSDVQHQRKLQLEWLQPERWASIYAEPEREVGKSSAPAEEADVWYVSWDAFRAYVDRGFIFDRPVVVKQTFQDSGMYNLEDYMATLWQRFADQDIDVQNSRTGICSSITMAEYCVAVSKLDLNSSDSVAHVSNALNLGRLARADEPLLTRLPRFRLLSTLVDRVNGLVGKRNVAHPVDVESSLHFNLLGFSGAFSRSHVDYMVGTWVRCLFGTKVWMITSGMQEEDWQRFARDGCDWSPQDKGRILILEQDDVLFMPPGLRVVHAVLTPEPSLVEGGMLWDEFTIPQILEGLLWIAKNQACTNEAIAYQLPEIIDALEQWAEQLLGASSSEDEQDAEYASAVREGVRALRALGCACGPRCESSADCSCKREQRRCTSWCLQHPLVRPSERHRDESGSTGAPAKKGHGGNFSCMQD